MSLTSGFLIPLCAMGALVSVAAAQKPKNAPEQLTARDMFYHPVKEAAVSATPPTKPVTPTAPEKGKVIAKRQPTQVAGGQKTNDTTPTSSVPPSQGQTLPDGGRIIQASARKTAPPPTEGPALGLRYTLVKKGRDEAEVATDTVFHNGDQIQLKIETNLPAYLYIITRGSSGTWKVQVPSQDAIGSNHVESMRPYYFPSSDTAFTFHDPKGVEVLFLMASREPVTDIQDTIYSLQGTPKPVSQPDPPPRQSTMIQAKLDIPDNKISQMRELYSRDLIIEKVNHETTGDKVETKEFAMYVVNPTGSPKSRLVADVSLEHQ